MTNSGKNVDEMLDQFREEREFPPTIQNIFEVPS